MKPTDRAERAARAVQNSRYNGSLVDLLADLMHWADHQPQDFDAALATAREHYAAEIEETDDDSKARRQQS